jgi:23S rRNA pseudouridine2605 synthase
MRRASRERVVAARPRGMVSLERALSKLGLASRSEARALVLSGRVRIGGLVVRAPALPVIPERLDVVVDDERRARAPWRLVAFHKPRGVVTTRRDPQGRQTVFDLLGEVSRGLIAIGRLDMASTGLLLFTNDTQLGQRLTDPANRIPRRYIVTVRGRVDAASAASLERGMDVRGGGGGRERLAASGVTILKASGRETHLDVELTEGRNRELRRLFEAVGHEVTRLHRVSFGSVALGDLPPGKWREVDAFKP